MVFISCDVFVQPEEIPANRVCAYECGPDKKCHAYTCCARRLEVTDDTSPLETGRCQSRKSTATSDGDVADARNDRQFTNILRTFMRNERQTTQTQDVEVCSNGVVLTTTTESHC